MFRAGIGLLWILACWRWGDWKNWKIYYPTILYYILIDFLTAFITSDYPLWEYDKYLINHTFSDIFVAFTVFPPVVMLYIPRFPKAIIKKALYVLLWAFIFISIEYVSYRLGAFKYHNGWNLGWSSAFNIAMFTMLRFHFKHPLLAWPLSGFLMTVTLWYFNLPVWKMR